MAKTPTSLFLLRRLNLTSQNPKPPHSFILLSHRYCIKPYSTPSSSDPAKPSSLSARMSFVFDQIDAIERERAQKDQTLQRIRSWRESKNAHNHHQQQKLETISTPQNPETISAPQNPDISDSQNQALEYGIAENGDYSLNLAESNTFNLKKEVEVAHPWPEWIELMERLVHQNYFDHRRKDEDKMIQNLGFDVSAPGTDGIDDDVAVGVELSKDFKAVQTAFLNFGKDRFDILRSLSRHDIQILVGYGCPSADRKVSFSAKLLRKHVHLDEGDVCSNCSLRNTCEKAYLLVNKEDEARTIDIMRVLLTYGFDPISGSVVNKSLLKQKSVRTVVRKLLHEVVKLSAVPIDPNLPRPVFKKPPPKVKQPPPPPRKRVGRDDIEMKKGDWLCPKCDFMNFAKNAVCLQCDAKRPKRQLLPGEWECPECNFLNYRRNMACFHCDCKRPPDEFMENKMEERQHGCKTRLEKVASRQEVSNAWNFDFDDNESDGADVAAFEYADSVLMDEDSPVGTKAQEQHFIGHDDDLNRASRIPRVHERREYSDDHDRPGMGFDDFDDDDDIDSYELDTQKDNATRKVVQNKFSEGPDNNMPTRSRTSPPSYGKPSNPMRQRAAFPASEDDDIDSDEDLPVHPKWKSSHIANTGHKNRGRGPSRGLSFGSDEELELDSDADDDFDEDFGASQTKGNKQGSGRRKFRSSADLEDVSFSGSESDNSNFRSRGKRSGGNRMETGRQGNKPGFGKRNFQRSSDSIHFSFSGSESDSNDRPTRGRRLGGNKMERGGRGNNLRGRGDYEFGREPEVRSKGKMRNRMKSRDDDRQNFGGPKREGLRNGQRERHSINMDEDFGEFRNSRRVIER